ncbi:MAG: PQQ-binding-like beta-propeller repeat protein [Rhodospirillales bacterium]|jgi:outer membrane protein assembly factor BamB|nr:PQQ-binding-like beta-propeller repeat protein [Rhodospirillales bacterium]
MTVSSTPLPTRASPGWARLSRRAALTLPLALSGCGLWHDWFGKIKPPIPGQREPVLTARNALAVGANPPPVVLPPPVANADFPQPGGNPAHDMGQLAARPTLAKLWETGIGAGGGYRQKLLATPVVANGVVYTMDVHARVRAFDLATGAERWRARTRGKHVRSTNVGGGLGIAGGVLYAANGLGELVALDAARGTEHWRTELGAPARSGPTIVAGRIFLTTIDDQLLALDAAHGQTLWSYQATNAVTALLGEPAPAYADGLVVGGFASGEITTLHADTGNVVWTDTLYAPALGGTLAGIASIRGLPSIANGRVVAIGMGGLAVAIDLPSGRRLWSLSIAGEDSPWVAGDWAFLVTLDQIITAVRIEDGTVAWATQLPRWENAKNRENPLTWFGPLLATDRLIVTGSSGEALSVSPYTGAILGRQKLPGPAAPVQPILAGGTLLLLSEDGRLVALR